VNLKRKIGNPVLKADSHTQSSAAATVNSLKHTGCKIFVRICLAMLALGGVGLGTFLETQVVHADSGSNTYTVDPNTAAGGVYARSTPHINDTQRINGFGVYPNQIVELLCGVTDGDPVGPYNNTTWHFVTDLSNPGEGNFWVSDHYLDTPNQPGQLTPGENTCADESTNPMATPATQPATVTAVFFSPDSTPSGLSNVANLTGDTTVKGVPLNTWAPGNCSDAAVVKQVPSTANTLAGWSRGRLGPLYFLAAATQAQKDKIHTIILFDPGNESDFGGHVFLWYHIGGACDWTYDPNTLYANWLKSNPSNRLIVITGTASEVKVNPRDPSSQSTYNGLQDYYFASVRNTTVGKQQVQVCDYNALSHDDVLRHYGSIVAAPWSGCPTAPDSTHVLTSWNP